MLSRTLRRLKKTVGIAAVLVGFLLAIGFAGSSDMAQIPLIESLIGAIGAISLMVVGSVMIGGAEE